MEPYAKHCNQVLQTYFQRTKGMHIFADRCPHNFYGFLPVIECLSNTELKTRKEVTRQFLCHWQGAEASNGRYWACDYAFDIAVQIRFMVDCSSGADPDAIENLELGTTKTIWRQDQNLPTFFDQAFPQSREIIDKEIAYKSAAFDPGLTARGLQKHARLILRPTNSLQDHLKLDRKNNFVYIFHQAAFLKEHLRRTYSDGDDVTTADWIGQ